MLETTDFTAGRAVHRGAIFDNYDGCPLMPKALCPR